MVSAAVLAAAAGMDALEAPGIVDIEMLRTSVLLLSLGGKNLSLAQAVQRLFAESWLRTSAIREAASNTRLPHVLSQSLKRFPGSYPDGSGLSMMKVIFRPVR
jgi:hypothetical protein